MTTKNLHQEDVIVNDKTEKPLFNLYRDLRRIFWDRSNECLVGWDIIDHMCAYKKYNSLSLDDMVKVFMCAVRELEGYQNDADVLEIYTEGTQNGDLREHFMTEADFKLAALLAS